MRMQVQEIRAAIIGALLLACSIAAPARAEYELSSGDVLDIVVFRVPELSRQATVDVDGRIAVPPLGLIEVRGHTLSDVSGMISQQLSGRDILPDAIVTVGLAAARPVFVGGDVVSPGSFPYQPELSVRRAIALAGGLGKAGVQALDQVPTLRGEQETLSAELFRLQSRVARLQAELRGEATFPTPESGPSGGFSLEAEQLKAAVEERGKEREHLARTVSLIHDRIDTLVAQQTLQQQILQNQGTEMDRIREIQDRGLTNLARVQDEQRTFETMQERASNTAAEIAQVRGQLEDAQHALDRFDARERAELERQLQEAGYAKSATAAQLNAVKERLAYLGFTGDEAPDVMIYRFRNGEEQTVAATEATPLMRGDMVAVALPVEQGPGATDAGLVEPGSVRGNAAESGSAGTGSP